MCDQKLGPHCLYSSDPFYVVECLQWDSESLKPRNVLNNNATDSGVPSELKVNTSSGLSVHYSASAGLLLHSYRSGYTVASVLSSDFGDAVRHPGESVDNLITRYSYLITMVQPSGKHPNLPPFGPPLVNE